MKCRGYSAKYLYLQGRRTNNEDSLAIVSIATKRHRYFLATVSDGIGGLEASEIASSFLSRRLRAEFIKHTQKEHNISLNSLETKLLRCLYDCHKQLVGFSESRDISLGTTTVILFFRDNKGRVISVGDSHVYQVSRFPGRVSQIAKSDSDISGRLTRAVGHGKYYKPHVRKVTLSWRKGFLLCTDGFYRKSGRLISRLSTFVFSSDVDVSLRSIHDFAVKNGEGDNSTAIWVERKHIYGK